MTYNNYDDTKVQIPREMFEARQRELAEISSGKKHKQIKKIPEEIDQNDQEHNNFNDDNANATTFKMILKSAIDTEISNVGMTVVGGTNKTFVSSIDEITTLNEPSSTTRSSCIVMNPNKIPQETENNVPLSNPFSPPMKFTVEERQQVERLVELEQSNVISFNDLEYDVASKVSVCLVLKSKPQL